MRSVQGVILTRRTVIEAHPDTILVPGSEWVACAWCGAECCASPSSLVVLAAGAPGVCYECVMRQTGGAVIGILADGAAEELELIDRLEGEAGRA